MPFDPQWPQNGQLVDADRFREQFTSLKSLIDAIQGGGITGAVVDSTSTVPSGTAAQVSVSVTGSTLHFSFQIPEGPQGNEGPAGAQGPPGEVTSADVTNAVNLGIQSTSNNSNAVGQMSLSVDPSYNQSQMQQISDKLDELILALRR